MAFHVRDPETDALVRELADKTKLGITEAVKLAATEALAAREKARAEKLARIDAILAGAVGRVREFTPLRPAMEPWGAELPPGS